MVKTFTTQILLLEGNYPSFMNNGYL